MANSLDSNTAEKLLKQFSANFVSDGVLTQTCGKQVVNDFDASTGDKVSMKRPTRYVPQRTADGDFTGKEFNPISTGKIQGEVGEYITIFTEMKDIEMALQLDQLGDGSENMNTLLGSAAYDMATEYETDLGGRMMRAAALNSGDVGTAISKWSDVASPGSLLDEIGAVKGNRYVALNSYSEQNLADFQTTLGVNTEVSSALSDATIRRKFAGFDNVMTTNNLPQKTHGTETATLAVAAPPLQTYNSAKDTMQMSLALSDGTAGGTITAGQQLRITERSFINMRNRKVVLDGAGAPIEYTCTVLEDATADGAGNYTLLVSGAAIVEAGVNAAFNTIGSAIATDDVVELLGSADATYRPNLAYCGPDFFGCGSVQLKPLTNCISKVITDDNLGISIRLTMDSDIIGNKNYARWDILPTFVCYNPFFGVQVGGAS